MDKIKGYSILASIVKCNAPNLANTIIPRLPLLLQEHFLSRKYRPKLSVLKEVEKSLQ